MDPLKTKISNLPEPEFPAGLHRRIMRRVWLKAAAPRLITALLLLANLGLSGWHLWVRTVEKETLPVLGAALQGFEWSKYFLTFLIETINESVPLRPLMIFIINLTLTLYLIYLAWNVRKTEIAKGRNAF